LPFVIEGYLSATGQLKRYNQNVFSITVTKSPIEEISEYKRILVLDKNYMKSTANSTPNDLMVFTIQSRQIFLEDINNKKNICFKNDVVLNVSKFDKIKSLPPDIYQELTNNIDSILAKNEVLFSDKNDYNIESIYNIAYNNYPFIFGDKLIYALLISYLYDEINTIIILKHYPLEYLNTLNKKFNDLYQTKALYFVQYSFLIRFKSLLDDLTDQNRYKNVYVGKILGESFRDEKQGAKAWLHNFLQGEAKVPVEFDSNTLDFRPIVNKNINIFEFNDNDYVTIYCLDESIYVCTVGKVDI
jgi:hypothetical protein